MPCPRCGGLAQEEEERSGEWRSEQTRCLNCGWVGFGQLVEVYSPVRPCVGKGFKEPGHAAV